MQRTSLIVCLLRKSCQEWQLVQQRWKLQATSDRLKLKLAASAKPMPRQGTKTREPRQGSQDKGADQGNSRGKIGQELIQHKIGQCKSLYKKQARKQRYGHGTGCIRVVHCHRIMCQGIMAAAVRCDKGKRGQSQPVKSAKCSYNLL